MFLGQLDQSDATFGGQRGAGGVLERRNRVDERRPVSAQGVDQRVDRESVGVDRDAHNPEPVLTEDVEGEEVRRLLHEHDIAGRGEHRTREVERLRVAVGHEQQLGVDLDAVSSGEERSEGEPQEPVAELGAVLQGVPLVERGRDGGPGEDLVGEKEFVGLTDSEIDHTGSRPGLGRGPGESGDHIGIDGVTHRSGPFGWSGRAGNR